MPSAVRCLPFLLLALASARPGAGASSPLPVNALSAAGQGTALTAQQLEPLVAPVALYPDALLAQVLMAATYPLEVVEASRWIQLNALAGEALAAALQEQSWDPSVKALCSVPSVLALLDDNLAWTKELGNAFLSQQAALLDAVQTMRRKAYEAGKLVSGTELSVTEQDDDTLVVESTDPEVIYVPTYYASAVYGGWVYPYGYYPALYRPLPVGGAALVFRAGVAWGSAGWGACRWGWGHSEIHVDVDRYNTFVGRTEADARRPAVNARVDANGAWRHDETHRRGVPYTNPAATPRPSTTRGSTAVARDTALGRTGAGRTAVEPGAADPAGRRSGQAAASRSPARTGAGPSGTGLGGSAHSGSRNPQFDHAASARGSASRNSAGSRGAAGGRRRR